MQQSYPQRAGIEKILKDAFSYWSGTIRYQLFFSVIYFGFLFLVFREFADDYGILQKYYQIFGKATVNAPEARMQMRALAESPQMAKLSRIMLATMVFLYPLNMGLYKIYRKIDLGQKPEPKDIFAGYSGVNFLIYTGFYLFWIIIFAFAFQTILPGILWIFITLFSAPLMFFADRRLFETLRLNAAALIKFFPEIMAGVFVAFVFRYAGLLAFGIGYLFTYPFYHAMIYALYKAVFSEEKKP